MNHSTAPSSLIPIAARNPKVSMQATTRAASWPARNSALRFFGSSSRVSFPPQSFLRQIEPTPSKGGQHRHSATSPERPRAAMGPRRA